MHRVEEYLRRAEEAEAQAAKLASHDMRESLMELARQWRSLARQAQALAILERSDWEDE